LRLQEGRQKGVMKKRGRVYHGGQNRKTFDRVGSKTRID
jgi:hypothetical protein